MMKRRILIDRGDLEDGVRPTQVRLAADLISLYKIESPFLRDELPARENEEWASQLQRLELLSPFHTQIREGIYRDDASGEFPAPSAPDLEGETVFILPKGAPATPTDGNLSQDLAKIKTKESLALQKAFASIGKPHFKETLIAALGAAPWEGEQDSSRYQMFLARLGAEAFIQDIAVPEENRVKVGFVNHPANISDTGSPSQRVFFLHFGIRRLLQLSLSASTSDQHRQLLVRATMMFSALQSELRREYGLTGIPEALLVVYRRLLTALV
jgi:hypothetical protein